MLSLDFLLITTSLILIILMYFSVSRYGFFGSISSPAMGFAVIWFFSVSSLIILGLNDFFVEFEFAKEPLSVLYTFVALTAVFFLFWEFILKVKQRDNVRIILELKNRNLMFMIYLVLLVSLIELLILYMNGEISTSVSQNRSLYLSGKGYSRYSSPFMKLISYVYFFKPYVYIFGGFFSFKAMEHRGKSVIVKVVILLFIISIIEVITTGGRNGLLKLILSYLFGFSLGVNLLETRKNIVGFRGVIYLVLVVVLFIGFINENAERRKDLDGVSESTIENYSVGIPSIFGGIVEYMFAHNLGFALRYDDTYNPTKLTYGVSTFYSFFNLNIPFAELLGLQFKRWDPLDYFNLESSDKSFYYTTHSVYAHLIVDFGFYGSIVAIFLITGCSQYLFYLFRNKLIGGSTVCLYLFFAFIDFWYYSNFYTSFRYPLVSHFIVFILVYFFLLRKIRVTSSLF
ncbi:MAG: oligosaccharide repeat unit polymerase [Chlamydiae bacterium]|nr:oligosaccharide repeat unit polymerase [Chlamydiota bacterium]